MRTLLLATIFVAGLRAQSQIAFEDSPYVIRVGDSIALGAYAQSVTGLRSVDGLQYATDSPQLISISDTGVVSGLFPGEASVTVTGTQASATWTLTVVPARIVLTPSTVELTVGEVMTLSAQAVDLQGKPIAGLTFSYSSSMPQLARMDGAKLSALAIGQTFVTARMDGLTTGSGTFATVGVRINPKPLYTMKALVSTATTQLASPVSYGNVASSNNRTAVVANFDNGGQAAVLIESGQPKVLMTAGQAMGENGTIVLRLNGISINRQGDVAVLADMGEYWCSSVIYLFPRAGSVVELPLGCSGWMGKKSVGNDGSLIYYQDNVPQGIVRRSPAGEVTLLLERNSTVTGLGTVRDFSNMLPNSDGTVMVTISPTSGTSFYAVYDGTKWTKAFTPGDMIDGLLVNSIDGMMPNGAGRWFFRASGSGFGVVASVDATGRRKAVLRQQEPADAPNKLGWPHRVVDADGDNLLLMAWIGVSEQYDNYMAWIKPGNQIQPIGKSHWDAIVDGVVTSSGLIAATPTDGVMKLQRIGSTRDVVMSPTTKLQVPGGTQWRTMRIGNRDSWALGVYDVFYRPSDGRPTLLPGQLMPSQQPLISIPSATTHPNGWTLFTALSQIGQGVYLSGNGRVTQLVDTGSKTTDVSGRPIQWVEWGGQNMRLAVNGKGDAVFGAGVNGNWSHFLQKQGEPLPRAFFGPSTVLPGNSFPAWTSQVDLDDAGTASFFVGLNGGGNGVYQVTGSTVKTLMSTRELFEGVAVRSLYNYCARNGYGLALFERPNANANSFALNTGGTLATVDFGTSDRGGVALSYMPGNACDASTAGDIFLVGQTSDGRVGFFHYSQATRKLRAVLLAGQKLADGSTLILPLQVSAGPNSSFFFAAQVYKQGVNSMAVYEAVPLP